jgi:uncharacterized membrane protein
MSTERLKAFSDGVIAIIITIMVLELKAPRGDDWSALAHLTPAFLSYVLSFVYVAIYWNNHHHLLHASERVDSSILWANMHLLFWLSLIPFATAWMGENQFSRLPTALYGVALLMPAIAYYILQTALVRQQGPEGPLAKALGRDIKGKVSPILYAAAIAFAFVIPWVSYGIFVLVALMWLVPDKRIEKIHSQEG